MRLDDEQIATLRDDLTKRLEIKADMLAMGERIAFGSDSAIMRQAAETIHAIATEVLESRAEIAGKDARIAELERALEVFQSYACPVCNGDCASANPPVSLCPMQGARAALGRDAT